MKKLRRLRMIAAALVAMFLATAVSASAFGANDDVQTSTFAYHQKAGTTPGSDHNFPFEEKEKEIEDRSESDPGTLSDFFVCLISTTAASADSDDDTGYDAPRVCGDSANLPRFLAKRTILI